MKLPCIHPATIATYVVTNVLSIANNLWAIYQITDLRHKFETISAIKQVMDFYYISCGDYDQIAYHLGIANPSDKCSKDKLTCITIQYCRKIGYQIYHGIIDRITTTQANTISAVNSIRQTLCNQMAGPYIEVSNYPTVLQSMTLTGRGTVLGKAPTSWEWDFNYDGTNVHTAATGQTVTQMYTTNGAKKSPCGSQPLV
ncbi:MAG: hypothetical protein HQK58_15130 [Deltaproteobacteria bacterium]|nr:hypothetical protein [Deltaproteobacteria bacterium]